MSRYHKVDKSGALNATIDSIRRRLYTMPKTKDNIVQSIMKYDRENTVQIKLKLNKKTDADILQKLEESGNKQGYLKALVRQDIEKSKQGKK